MAAEETPDIASVRLPTRYEDLDPTFRRRLRPVPDLIEKVQSSLTSMRRSGGLRFLPMFGESGSGKSCAALELGTHLPECAVFRLTRDEMSSSESLRDALLEHDRRDSDLVIAIVDQYEEAIADELLPARFVEWLSLLDRGDLRTLPTLVIWLTTSEEFQQQLAAATSRNSRILLDGAFKLSGPTRATWPDIIEETFAHHNGRPLADYEVLPADLERISRSSETLGDAIEEVGENLSAGTSPLQDFSKLTIFMLWPVTDGNRLGRIVNLTSPRDGYRLDWNAWYRELPAQDRANAETIEAYNRTRLYFDIRLIPIMAADLQQMCRDLDAEEPSIATSHLERFRSTHFFRILSGAWDPTQYSPMREWQESSRAREATAWYRTVTTRPAAIGRRIAFVLRESGLQAQHETEIASTYSTVKADVLIDRDTDEKPVVIVELKAFAPENTMPSTIRDQVKTTLRRHAQLVGFLPRI